MSITKVPFPELVAQKVAEMRGYALRLSGGDHARADDLQQDTIVNALAAESSFVLGTNIEGWLTTIMKNRSYTLHRKKREAEDPEGVHEATLSVEAEEVDEAAAARLRRALETLPREQRDVLLLSTEEGLSYAEISDRLRIEEGTVKSRMNRARVALGQLLGAGTGMEKAGTGYVRAGNGHLEIRNNDAAPELRSFSVSKFLSVEPVCEPGPLPDLLWLPVADLRIDERYQRSVLRVGMNNIRHIAANFHWSKFTAVCVARWEGV